MCTSCVFVIDYSITACEDSFELFQDYSAGSGSRLSEIDTLDDCKDQCLATDGCKGVDWNEERERCYIFTDDTDLRRSSEYDHHVLLKCLPFGIEPTPPPTPTSCEWKSTCYMYTWLQLVRTHTHLTYSYTGNRRASVLDSLTKHARGGKTSFKELYEANKKAKCVIAQNYKLEWYKYLGVLLSDVGRKANNCACYKNLLI